MKLTPMLSAICILLVFANGVSAMTVEYPGESSRLFTMAQKTQIQEIADRTELEVRKLLPTLQARLTLAVQTGNQVIPETGDGGSSLTSDRILWTVDPTHAGGLQALIEKRLRSTLFHEMHHLARGWTLAAAPQSYKHFLDAAISEGMATVFAREFAGDRAPWGQYPENVAEWAREVSALPADAPYQLWMFQHPDGRRWIGYAVGTYLVDRAMRATSKNAAELVNMSTTELMAALGKI